MKKIWLLVAATMLLGAAGCAEDRDPSPDDSQGRVELPTPPDDATPSHLIAPRLTQQQYARAIRDVLGEEIVVPTQLEPDSRNNGFVAVGAVASAISPRGVEQYEDAAYEIAQQVMRDEQIRSRIVGCEPADASTFDEACASGFIEETGLALWRRPMTDQEVATAVGLARNATETLGDFWEGMEFGLAALLQSPHFIYRTEDVESGEPRALDDFEMATRLSFVLWNTTPDRELLAAAAAGELTEDETLNEHVWRMLEDPRAQEGVRAFFTDLFELDRLDELTKAPELFPHISEEVGPSAREETLRVIEELVFERGDFRDIMTTRRTYLNPKLASIYNVRAPARQGFAEYVYPDGHPRVGLLGHASFLALWAHPVSTSATLRGIFVQTKLLCRVVPPPPSGVDTSIPVPSGETPTLRDRIKEHLEDPTCASCHNITDPIGLSFEHFDGIGRYRQTDDGAEIDTSGKVDSEEFETMADLAGIIRNHERFGPCLSEKLYTYATGHEVERNDRTNVEYLATVFEASGYDLLTLIHAMVTSPSFRSAAPAEGGE